jgi:hypothetical protein
VRYERHAENFLGYAPSWLLRYPVAAFTR